MVVLVLILELASKRVIASKKVYIASRVPIYVELEIGARSCFGMMNH